MDCLEKLPRVYQCFFKALVEQLTDNLATIVDGMSLVQLKVYLAM